MIVLIILICIVLLSFLNVKEKWNNNIKPPSGCMQYKNFKIKM